MSSDNVNGGDQCKVTTLFCNSWFSKWGGPTVDVTILKEIYYSIYLPNDISCTGNDITVGCSGLWKHFAPLHSPHWTSIESCFVIGKVSIVNPLALLPPNVRVIPLFGGTFWFTIALLLVIFQNGR